MNRTLIWIDASDPLPSTDCALTAAEGANGLLAAGSDLSAKRLEEAYSRGIFPWFSRGEPVLWWTPAPRMVLMLDEFKISKSFRKTICKALKTPELTINSNHDFTGVMQACAAPRNGKPGTWISPPMIGAYADLHGRGLAHSVEVRREGSLIGGLYCVSLGRMVFGESMFSHTPNASKLALATLVTWMQSHDARVIDCQQHTGHLASLGGREIDRPAFESLIAQLTQQPALPWQASPPTKEDLSKAIDHG